MRFGTVEKSNRALHAKDELAGLAIGFLSFYNLTYVIVVKNLKVSTQG
jgi:hypothetical protein